MMMMMVLLLMMMMVAVPVVVLSYLTITTDRDKIRAMVPLLKGLIMIMRLEYDTLMTLMGW